MQDLNQRSIFFSVPLSFIDSHDSETCSKLPSELVCLILSQLDSVQDLYSTIRVSKGIYAAFQHSKHIILCAAVRNVVKPEVLPDALFAVRVRQSPLQQPDHLRAALGLHETAMCLAEAEQLLRLWYSCDYFVKKCSAHLLSNAERQAKSQNNESCTMSDNSATEEASLPLSALELRRIERAIWRYATFQNVVDDPSNEDREASSTKVALLFTHHAPWEIEEVACVHHYISHQLGDVFRELDDYFVNSVRSDQAPSISRYLPWGDEGSLGLESQQAEAPFFDSDDWIFIDSEKRRRCRVVQHLASLGLPFLRSLLEADPDTQKHMITENYDYQTWGLDAALRLRPQSQTGVCETEYTGCNDGQARPFEGDDLHRWNQAWLWAHRDQLEIAYFSDCNVGLREWGYVFWDSDRLQRWAILDQPRPVLHANQLPEDYHKRPAPSDGPSAHQRLRDLCLA